MDQYKLRILSALLQCLELPSFFNLFGYYMNRMYMPAFNYFYPINIDIEPTINCNINCEFCQSSSLKRNKHSISLFEFKKIVNSIPNTIKINIQGMGEPLLNKELYSMISYAKKKKNYVLITTNGTLLSEKTSKELIASGLDRLIISFDSAKKESYEKVRKGANFDKVVNNISNFMKIRGSQKKPFVSLWMLGQKETINLKCFPKIILLPPKAATNKVLVSHRGLKSLSQLVFQSIDTIKLRYHLKHGRNLSVLV